MLLLFLDLDIWETSNYFAILEWEAKEVSCYIHFIWLSLVKFAGNHILNCCSNVENSFTFDEIIVLNHAQADKIFEVKKKLASFSWHIAMQEGFGCLFPSQMFIGRILVVITSLVCYGFIQNGLSKYDTEACRVRQA